MKKGMLINDLELGYAPMSAYAFMQLTKEKEFLSYVIDSHIYIIAQRRELTFNNFSLSEDKKICFEIWQENNSEIVYCLLPMFQEHIVTDLSKSVELRLQNRKNTISNKSKPPFNDTQGIIFAELNEKTGERKHLIWFSPDKLLQNYWKGYIEMEISGDFKNMLEFNVHYVGKSTEQNICKRLSSHSTFQEILINEDVLTFGNIPSNEIMILLFRVKDNNTVMGWGEDSTGDEMADYILNYSLPDDITISSDAEKALIQHLSPGYNKILYKNFPTQSDLVNNDRHGVVLYGVVDPITLKYDTGKIKGGDWIGERDYIKVERKD